MANGLQSQKTIYVLDENGEKNSVIDPETGEQNCEYVTEKALKKLWRQKQSLHQIGMIAVKSKNGVRHGQENAINGLTNNIRLTIEVMIGKRSR